MIEAYGAQIIHQKKSLFQQGMINGRDRKPAISEFQTQIKPLGVLGLIGANQKDEAPKLPKNSGENPF
jgi:hypothetical protein